MKNKKVKLTLNKVTIAMLDNQEKSAVKGGYYWTDLYHNCYTWYPQCPSKYATICSCPQTCNFQCAVTVPPTND
ncbi:MAG: class I lanthipeptide [Acidobacteria bacterium]|nr:class I lanthipeptide [Acidobacteriota bacterium]